MLSRQNTHARADALTTRGFTLVEILVVVVILGIASAIIIPQIGSRDDLVVAAAARSTMADLIYAQNRAIATQKWHYVQFVGQQYSLLESDTDTSTPYSITHPITKNAYNYTFGAAGTPLSNVSLDSTNFGASILCFNELGSPYSFNGTTKTALVNTGTMVLKSGSATLTISVEPYTGELTVN